VHLIWLLETQRAVKRFANSLYSSVLLTYLAIPPSNLRSMALARTHTCSSGSAIVESSGGTHCWECLERAVSHFPLSLLSWQNVSLLSFNFNLGNNQKSLGASSGEYGGCGKMGMFCWRKIAAQRRQCDWASCRGAGTTPLAIVWSFPSQSVLIRLIVYLLIARGLKMS